MTFTRATTASLTAIVVATMGCGSSGNSTSNVSSSGAAGAGAGMGLSGMSGSLASSTGAGAGSVDASGTSGASSAGPASGAAGGSGTASAGDSTGATGSTAPSGADSDGGDEAAFSGAASSGSMNPGTSGVSSGTSGAAGASGTSGPPTPDPSWGTPVPSIAYSGATVTGTVKVDPATMAGKIGTGFAGFSFEKTHITNGSFTGTNAALISLMKLLPGTVMRLGADDVDKCTYIANAPVQRTAGSFSHSIGSADVDGLADFVKATGAHVIYGVNFKLANPETSDAQEAAYAMSKMGDFIDGFEIGNEINGVGSWTQLKSKWELIQSTMAKAAPTAKFIGPAGEGGAQSTFDTPFAHDEASKVVTLTQHYYAGTADQAGVTNATYLSKLLVPDPFALTDSAGLIEMEKVMSMNVTANNIPGGFRIGECNTFSHHGQNGVSNTLVSALWSLDYMFTSAQYGASGVNFHGGEKGMDGNTIFYYSPIDESNGVVQNVNPIFYGILLFTLAGTGNALATTAMSTATHFTAYALARTDGAMSVIVDNKDATTGVTTTVDIGKAVASASAIYLEGPSPASLTAPSGVTLAGSGITAAGAWARKPPYALATAGNSFTITVPPASAALVRVQ